MHAYTRKNGKGTHRGRSRENVLDDSWKRNKKIKARFCCYKFCDPAAIFEFSSPKAQISSPWVPVVIFTGAFEQTSCLPFHPFYMLFFVNYKLPPNFPTQMFVVLHFLFASYLRG